MTTIKTSDDDRTQCTIARMTKPPFEYHPHMHVKIWLSRDPSVFMNLENQIRLIDMRQTNPSDVIHLLYDTSLLEEKACRDLVLFCEEQHIIPIDAQQLQTQLHTHEELVLYTSYLDEIRHLDAGGNLGVASDIIRWLTRIRISPAPSGLRSTRPSAPSARPVSVR